MTLIAHAPLQGDLSAATYDSSGESVVPNIIITTTGTGNFVSVDSDRVAGIQALALENGKNVNSAEVPLGANIISFWGSANSGAWNFYIFFNNVLYKNNSIDLSGDDFTILYQTSAFRLVANVSSKVADIRFHKIDDITGDIVTIIDTIYALLNKHPMTPTFGFYQQSHSSNIGIIGNQLSNSLVAFKKGSDDLSFNLADFQCNNLLSNNVYTKQEVDATLTNIDLSSKADTSTVNALSSTVAAKADASTVTAIASTVAGKADASTVNALSSTVAAKADASALSNYATTIALSGKADASALSNYATTIALSGKADSSAVNALASTVAGKADSSALSGKADASALSNYATTVALSAKADSSAVNALSSTVAGKADASALSNYATTIALSGKADSSTVNALSSTVAGKADVSAVASKANADDVYTRSQSDSSFGVKADKYSYQDGLETIDVTLETLDNQLITNSNTVINIAANLGSHINVNSTQPDIISHIPLQNNLVGISSGTHFNASIDAPSFIHHDIPFDRYTTYNAYKSVHITGGAWADEGISYEHWIYPSSSSAAYVNKYVYQRKRPTETSNDALNCICYDYVSKTWSDLENYYGSLDPYFVDHVGNTVTLKDESGNVIGVFADPYDFPTTFVDIDSFDFGNVFDKNTLAVSNIHTDYDGTYSPSSDFSVSVFDNHGTYPALTITTIAYESGFTIFQNTTDTTKFLCLPKGGNVSGWTFFTMLLAIPSTPTMIRGPHFPSFYTPTLDIQNVVFNDVTYPVLQGTFCHNLDISRVSGINALALTSEDTITIDKHSDFLSFWAWTPNASSWSLYTAAYDNTSWSLNRNNVADITFTITTTESLIGISNTSSGSYITDIKQYPEQPYYDTINVHPKNPIFGFHHSGYSTDIGIAGNQLDDALRVVNFGHDNQLADLHIANLTCSGLLLGSGNITVDDALRVINGDNELADLHIGNLQVSNMKISTVEGARVLVYNYPFRTTTASWYLKRTSAPVLTLSETVYDYGDGLYPLQSCNLTVNGELNCYGTIFSTNLSIQALSDDRLKFDEKILDDASGLLKLRPQMYKKGKSIDDNVEDAKFEVGLIAQEVWYDAPEFRHLVSVGEGGSPADTIATSDDPTVDPDYSSWGTNPASIGYTGFIPYLIRGFQEHHAENTALKEKVENLEAQIAMLMKASGLVDSGNVES